MSVQIEPSSAFAQQVLNIMVPKIAEMPWATGDDVAFGEYIMLMLVNGKDEQQVATDLSTDLLGLDGDDSSASDFSRWLFATVRSMQAGEGAPQGSSEMQGEMGQDTEMSGATEGSVAPIPTGPKSMRNASDRGRDKRLLGHLARNMDRPQDNLHKVRQHNGISARIDSHSQSRGRGNSLNVRGRGGVMQPTRGGLQSQGSVQSMSLQQQADLMAMLEQQTAMMSQLIGGGMPMPGMNGFKPQVPGPSLFDRVQPGRGGLRGRGRGGRGGAGVNGHTNAQQSGSDATTTTSAMDVELTPTYEKPTPDARCKFDKSCANKDCMFGHQSPAAPPGTTIDNNDVCAFGAACTNRKCTGRHPSPAQKVAHAAEMDCKFYPNCTNPRCPFKHGPAPCRNGADCTTPDCKFAHSKVVCKFNPCLNPKCVFKHEEGQKRGKFSDKVWVAGENNHVSERKFIDESSVVEELIVPGNGAVDIQQDTGMLA